MDYFNHHDDCALHHVFGFSLIWPIWKVVDCTSLEATSRGKLAVTIATLQYLYSEQLF